MPPIYRDPIHMGPIYRPPIYRAPIYRGTMYRSPNSQALCVCIQLIKLMLITLLGTRSVIVIRMLFSNIKNDEGEALAPSKLMILIICDSFWV